MSTRSPAEPYAPVHPRSVFQARARTFWFAARFLPAQRRPAVSGLYTFARCMDDLVDAPPPDRQPEQTRAVLDQWRDWLVEPNLASAPDPGVALAVIPVLESDALPAAYLQLLIDGVASDLSRTQMGSWIELREYCTQVASSVGLAMCHLLGSGHDPLAREAAVELGIAMQLTNILRDVGADLRVGRVYLPSEELEQHGSSREHLVWLADQAHRRGPPAIDRRFRRLMRAQIARARMHYVRGVEGVWRLPVDSQLAILLAARLYAAILEAIESADYDVFTRRASTSAWLKLSEAARCSVLVRTSGRPTPTVSAEPRLAVRS